jgi:DNA-binding transcriptional regulator YiaG
VGRTLEQVTQSLSIELQQEIETGTKDLILEVETIRLKQLRERWGISQQELAKILNVSQPAVSKLEDRPVYLNQSWKSFGKTGWIGFSGLIWQFIPTQIDRQSSLMVS